jgi:predicted lipoprotein
MMKPLLFLLAALLLAGCGDNASQERNATNFAPKTDYAKLPDSAAFSEVALLANLKRLFVLQAETYDAALNDFADAADALLASPSEANVQTLQNDWVAMMQDWKKIQSNWAFEIKSGCCNELVEFIDQSDLVNPSKKPPAFYAPAVLGGADVTSSTRYTDIGLLEALLFMYDEINATNAGVIREIATAVQTKSAELLAYWETEERFLANTGGETLDAILNHFIDNIYKNKEQRLGEPAGLTAASYGIVDGTKLEYLHSQKSKESLIARITGLKELYTGDFAGETGGVGFDDYLISKGATSQNRAILDAIDNAITTLEAVDGPLETALTADATGVAAAYAALSTLYTNIYTTLPAAMKIIPKIVEADGD